MTIDEKIGQLTQYNAILFHDSSADVTGPMIELGLTADRDKTRIEQYSGSYYG